MKNTPGPWEASEGHPSDVWHVDMPNRWYSVIVSRGEDDWDMPVEEIQANARLIAAAPDLLAVLERIIKGLANGGELEGLSSGTPVSVPVDDIWSAVEAIAKAKGGE